MPDFSPCSTAQQADIGGPMKSAGCRIWLVPLALLWWGCTSGGREVPLDMHWKPLTESNAQLPPGIRVFAGVNRLLPLRAWYVGVNERSPEIETTVVLAADEDLRATVSSIAARLNASVVVNGGYFRMDLNPTRHVGLLMIDSVVIQPNISAVTRSEQRFPLARAAVGFSGGGQIDVAWTFNRGDSLLEVSRPPAHLPGQPDTASGPFNQGRLWPVREALGGGPSLVSNGKVQVTADEEVFFGTSIPKIHPRTACGYTADGKLILLVVDGRQEASRGVNLQELALIMQQLGCVEALNLDGGGSSTLVAGGRLINRPEGGTAEREVMSALAVFSREEPHTNLKN